MICSDQQFDGIMEIDNNWQFGMTSDLVDLLIAGW